MPVVYVLMARRDVAAYTRVFTAIRNQIILQFGDLGRMEEAILITDWEPAAFTAFIAVFPLVISRVKYIYCYGP